MVDFRRLLSDEARGRLEQHEAMEAEQQAKFAAMANETLTGTARRYMLQMQPIDWPPGAPVYDAVFWHIIIPELLKRIDRTPEIYRLPAELRQQAEVARRAGFGGFYEAKMEDARKVELALAGENDSHVCQVTEGGPDERVCEVCDGGPGNNCACSCGLEQWDDGSEGGHHD